MSFYCHLLARTVKLRASFRASLQASLLVTRYDVHNAVSRQSCIVFLSSNLEDRRRGYETFSYRSPSFKSRSLKSRSAIGYSIGQRTLDLLT